MKFDINFFNNLKPELLWVPVIEWVRGRDSYRHFAWRGLIIINGQPSGVPLFFLYVNVNEVDNATSVSLYVNFLRDPVGKGQKLIETQLIGNKDAAIEVLPKILMDKYGIDIGKSDVFWGYFKSELPPIDVSGTKEQPQTTSEDVGKIESKKLLNKKNLLAAVINLYRIRFYSKISKDFINGYQIYEIVLNFKTEEVLPKRNIKSQVFPTYDRCEKEVEFKMSELKNNGFVDVPAWADMTTWDLKTMAPVKFYAEKVKSTVDAMENMYKQKTLEEIIQLRKKMLGKDDNEIETSGSILKNKRYSQSEWYAGDTPNPKKIEQYLGSPNVDATQIKSVFIGVDDAVNLVNKFDSSLLLNVGFIFNFSNQGAYGVYLPALDDKIKREKIKSALKQNGCKIDEKPDGSFIAYSETKTPDEIQKEIDTMDGKLKQEGGHVFGINMNKVLMASKADSNAMNLTNQEDINDIITLHLGATIAHEAVHAKGSTSEGPSEQIEQAFFSWSLPIINQKRLERHKSSGNTNEFSPLVITPYRRGASRGWYKKAQSSFPTGAQFSANTPEAYKHFSGFDYGLMFGNLAKGAIESKLEGKRESPGAPMRDFPIEKKISLMNEKIPAIRVDKEDFITEVLLEKDRKEFEGYSLTEKLLENRRPKPIILPKISSNKGMKKLATLFGWMSNLDLPMRERIIPGEESDDFLNFDWKKMKELPRYNYDGQAYVYVEPRFEPELWDQMIVNRPTSFINPARRFAQKKDLKDSQDPNYKIILNVLNVIENNIKIKKIMGTRLVCSEDVLPFIIKFYKHEKNIKVLSIKKDKFDKHDHVSTVWIYRSSIPENKVKLAEDYVSGVNKSKEAKDIFDFLMGSNLLKKNIIKTILNMAKNVCEQYKIEDVFVVGGFPRSIAMKESWNDVHDLDFAAAWPDQCVKLGGMLADALNVKNTELFHRTMTLSWEWMGLKCDFKGNFNPVKPRNLLRQHNIKTTPLNMDIYGRDFTINMLVYDINKRIIYDVCKQSMEDIKRKTIRTYFPETENIIKMNPMIILRTMKYMIRYGFAPDSELDRTMRNNKELLFNGTYSQERIGLGFLELLNENAKKARKVIEEYGLTEKCVEYIKYANAN